MNATGLSGLKGVYGLSALATPPVPAASVALVAAASAVGVVGGSRGDGNGDIAYEGEAIVRMARMIRATPTKDVVERMRNAERLVDCEPVGQMH